MAEIAKSKNTFCSYTDKEYAQYDIILPSLDKVNIRTIAEAKRNKAKRLTLQAFEKAKSEGKKVKQLELYKASAINQVFETGLPSELPKTLEAIFKPLGIIWNKKEALQIENK